MDKKEENQVNYPIKKLVSKRDIDIAAFELLNGDLMLEATFLDTNHLIRLNLQIEPEKRRIVGAKCEFTNYPHTLCRSLEKKAELLIGLEIKRGITREIIERTGGSEGCAHLKEIVLDTINFAAMVLLGSVNGFGLISREFNLQDEKRKFELSKDILRNTCFVYKDKEVK